MLAGHCQLGERDLQQGAGEHRERFSVGLQHEAGEKRHVCLVPTGSQQRLHSWHVGWQIAHGISRRGRRDCAEDLRCAETQFVEIAFRHVGLNWRDHVVIDPAFVRPAEVDLLLSDPSKARRQLGWVPKVAFEELVTMMVDSDVAALSGSAQRLVGGVSRKQAA